MDESDLAKWCAMLESPKVKPRREACIELTEHLRQKSTIDFLNNSETDWWNRILGAVFTCMNEDHEKQIEDLRKKSKESSNSPPSADLFAFFVRIAVKEESSVDYLKLFHVIGEWLGNPLKKQFHHQLLKILSDSLLMNSRIRSLLEECHWVALYFVLKKLCGDGSASDNEQIMCLALVMKLGPLNKFPVMVLRQQFDYVLTLSTMVTSKSSIPQQNAVVDIVYNFCKYTAKDNRMACCKLGEDVFFNFVDLYQTNENEDRMKTNLINFFLLQIAIHNPKGAQENHPAAYAASWDIWKSCLCGIYDVLSNEIDTNFSLTVKNRTLFITENDVNRLFDGFVRLFVEACRQLFSTDVTSVDEPPAKRPRTEFTINNLINKITETKSWPWINLTYSLIETYPDMITPDDYVIFLKNLSVLQSECKEVDTLHHIHKALTVLLKTESSVSVEMSRIDSSWKSIADATLRLMNQNDENIQTLVQLLIINKHLNSHDQLMQYFRPGGALSIDEHNLKTVDVAFKNFASLQLDKSLKKQTINWVLSTNSEHYCCSKVAEILICLVLKQWPNRQFTFSELKKPFEDIESAYFDVCFESLLVNFKNKEENESGVYCVDQSLLDYLSELLKSLISNLDLRRKSKEYFNLCMLVFNVISFVDKYKLIESEAITRSTLYELFEKSMKNLFDNVSFKMSKLDEKSMLKFTKLARILIMLFSTQNSDFISQKLREFVSEQLIRDMFGILNTREVPGDVLVTLKKCLVEAIVSFSCLPKPNSDFQKRALKALVGFNYNCDNDDDYELVLTLMRSLKSCKPKSLSVKNLLSIFDVLQKFCEIRYYCNISVLELLDFFYAIYPLVVASDCQDCKSSYVRILYPFYAKRLSYEPSIVVRLVKCMGLLFELEPSATHTRWRDEDIVLKIPEFLKNDHQEVRFSAVRTLASIFRVSSQLRLMGQFHTQEIIFSKISDMSLKVLELEDNINKNRIADEVIARSSSILHTFASIMIASNLWIEESLFTLLKIVCDKNLGLSLVETVIDIVGKELGFKSGLKFLEKYLVGLVNRWKPYNFEEFPFSIFKCSSKIDLFSKYWPLLAHIFVEDSENSLNQVASSLRKSLQTLIEDTCPKLLSYCIGQQVADFSSMKNNKISQLLRDTLGLEKSQKIFKNNIEEIILCLADFVSDEQDFESRFDRSIIFPVVTEVRLTIAEFHDCLQYIQGNLYGNISVMTTLIQNSPEKIHFILLQLNLRVYGIQALEDKLRYFHLYSLIASICIETVISEPSMQPYLIRDLTHTLLHHIKNHKSQPELSEMSCKFFKTFLSKILPSLSTVLSQFFLTIISRLKYVALENCAISALCVDMLELLIVDHQSLFCAEISRLDSLPEKPQFEKIFSVHRSLKYENKNVTLEDEIVQFLDFSRNIESLDECEHSVTHLKQVIIAKKDELKEMYERLRLSRGFSEDCKSSNLHKLICMLITLSCSNNSNVSTEAAKCLGEIGPADLATLILQPEKDIADAKWTPFELLLGCAISLLLKYLVDADVTVIKASSMALFQILSTKESRKVIQSNDDFGFGTINSKYLTPFCAIDLFGGIFKVVINGDYFMKTMQDDALWIPDDVCHETWVTRLVCAFLESFDERMIFDSFIEMCKQKVEFCEQILPLVVYTVLFLNNFSFTTIISSQIETFFNKHWEITVKNQKVANITTNKSSVQTMLNVVHFVRLQRNVRKKEIKDMKLDYLRVAKAAHFCTAHFTALLYAELWCQEQINKSPKDYALSTCSYTKLDLIYENVDEITGNALQNILRQAYKCVGETDALLGCGTSHLLSPASRVDHYKELGRWDQVTQYYERQVSLGRNVALAPLVDSLKNANLYQLSLFCPSQEPNYESLWRLSQWDHSTNDLSQNTYDKCKFHALKALHDCEEFTFKNFMSEGRVCVVEDFMGANMESIKNFYNTFTKLQCLKEIEEFAIAAKSDGVVDLLLKWKVHDDVVSNDYHYVEPVQAQRILLFTDFLQKLPNNSLKDVIVDTILSYAQCARIEGNSHVAFRILESLRLLPPTTDIDAKIKLEEAQLCWSIQDVVTAKCILRQLCIGENVNPRMNAMALKLTGTWMVESSSENRQTIIENFFKKSLDFMRRDDDKTEEDQKSIVDTFHQLAKFADQEYQVVMSHIKSDVFQKKKENIVKSRNLVNSINLQKTPPTKDLKKAIMIKKKLSCIDEIEIHNIEAEKNSLLLLALKYYLRILIRSDNYNMTIFRLFSLLLENRDNEIVKSVLEKDLLKIPTYKFINILPQIIPHISNASNDIFSQTVNNLIEKCAKDHPYHTLPLILALALSNKDREYSTESKAAVNDTRTQTAKAILKNLKRDSKLSNLIEKMEFVSEAVIELAYHQSTCNRTSYKVPTNSKIRKIQNWGEVLLPTYILPVDKSCTYESIIGIEKFQDTYHNVGGINAPKRITCVGTDGITRSQLIKGQDDIRQDAVMQQVFTIMNSLLTVNKQTKNLRIRTYKIVPLSMRSGILEWVENTMPIGEYLTGERSEGGAHVKFHPSDKKPNTCRVDFKNASGKSNEEKLRAFNKICSNIKPVFHKFFETSFPQPTVWYERRRTYTHSVATSSMCGYILGIGDRHLNNILIDKNTAEVVHIDFGIAFEQGRVLPTPETVPFRLTRDLVDGMGVSGVEGVFRRSCEKTVEVLRLHYQTIITILEVLLYDPLYDWTVSTAEANKRQKDEEDDAEFNGSQSGSDERASRNVNETAERALLRLRAKLQGTESGKSTSVEHQVGTLIQQAVDPSNLSKLFYGWQPYL